MEFRREIPTLQMKLPMPVSSGAKTIRPPTLRRERESNFLRSSGIDADMFHEIIVIVNHAYCAV